MLDKRVKRYVDMLYEEFLADYLSDNIIIQESDSTCDILINEKLFSIYLLRGVIRLALYTVIDFRSSFEIESDVQFKELIREHYKS